MTGVIFQISIKYCKDKSKASPNEEAFEDELTDG